MAHQITQEEILVNKFTEESAKHFRQQVFKQAMLDPNLPIVVYIDSYGGYVDSLNSMLETIEQVSNPIVTVCVGKAMSCGAVLLAAGDFRFCGRHSRVMVHQASSGTGGPIEGLQNDVNESKRLNKELMTIIAKRCKMSLSEFKKEMKARLVQGDDEARDMYLTADDALKIGIVDFIGTPLIKPVVMYTIEPSVEKKYEDISALGQAVSLDEEGHAEPVVKKTRKKTKKKATKKQTR